MCKLLFRQEAVVAEGRADLTVTDSTRRAMWASSSSPGRNESVLCVCVSLCIKSDTQMSRNAARAAKSCAYLTVLVQLFCCCFFKNCSGAVRSVVG